MSIFKTAKRSQPLPADPEALFGSLSGRAEDIRHLWIQQAEILRSYKDHSTASDLAFELPTGSGKTLVGLLIGEWRRLRHRERVAYLCPTRQLSRQVEDQARQYGIRAHALVGPQKDYPSDEFHAYVAGEAIAITTYSGVFNNNPRINDAQTLILDDAHASENFIARMWSVEIFRSEHHSLYFDLLRLLKRGLPTALYEDFLEDSSWDPRKAGSVDSVPGSYFRSAEQEIRSLLESGLSEDKPSHYSWRLIRDHLNACQVFVAWNSILIRPILPPSLTHQPFDQANQRLYMSATLGAGGDLERITGVKSIQRLPSPGGQDERGTGRRLFLLPEVVLSEEDAAEVILQAVQCQERSLVLRPSQSHETLLVKKIREATNVLAARNIEEDLADFISEKNVALLLERYDGLDLPGDACRLLVIAGLPRGINLQERFLSERLAAGSVLRDRVLTRFAQGVGRCTRSDNDYALVFISGSLLVGFLLKRENRSLLGSELQAELDLGLDLSRDKKPDEFEPLWREFLNQSDEWKEEGEAQIANRREHLTRQGDPISERLKQVVQGEVDYLYQLWGNNSQKALEKAVTVADQLGGDETKGYRAWWYYLAAEAAAQIYNTDDDPTALQTAEKHRARAAACLPALSFFSRIRYEQTPREDSAQSDELLALAAENVRDGFETWGTVGPNFEKVLSEVRENLDATEHKAFHRGLQGLGELLGFRAELPRERGEPDCLWALGTSVYIVHEAKSEHKDPEAGIGINDVRQAQSHVEWVKEKKPQEDGTEILALLESPRSKVEPEATTYAKNSLFLVGPHELEKLFSEIAGVLRRIRVQLDQLADEQALEEIFRGLSQENLAPQDILHRLSRNPVANKNSKPEQG